ncbi:unnamed protein product, partial [marine sediment metagenome]
FISGCIGFLTTPGEDEITPGKGRLEIYLTDSSEKYKANNSENYLAVYITISKIEAHIVGKDEGAEGEWVILRDWSNENEPVLPVFDLMILQDVFELLVDGSFDVGKYTQLRLFISEVSVLVEGGASVEPVEIPSVYQTGIKLIHPFEIVDGEEIILTIDFDADGSIIKTGNGSYKLEPVIKVVTGFTDENGEEE